MRGIDAIEAIDAIEGDGRGWKGMEGDGRGWKGMEDKDEKSLQKNVGDYERND